MRFGGRDVSTSALAEAAGRLPGRNVVGLDEVGPGCLIRGSGRGAVIDGGGSEGTGAGGGCVVELVGSERVSEAPLCESEDMTRLAAVCRLGSGPNGRSARGWVKIGVLTAPALERADARS